MHFHRNYERYNAMKGETTLADVSFFLSSFLVGNLLNVFVIVVIDH
jgi:hypothetical protein